MTQVGFGYPNAWTLLNGRRDPIYVPFDPRYTFGGGDPSTFRYGQDSATEFLNIFRAQTDSEFNVINEVYDTHFRVSPTQPGNVFCWMCNTFTKSMDSSGDTHFLIELKQNLRWHDGSIVDSKDVKFSLLNLRDFAFSAGGSLGRIKSVDVLNPSVLDITVAGQSFSSLFDLIAYVIPRHLWELAGDATYGDVGRVDPAKASYSYDPLTSGTLVGSGPFLCRSIFASDMGSIGTGCAINVDGSRAGQSISIGGSMLLQAFDRTSEPGNSDPFLQYMRSYNPSWGTGTGTAAFSGQFQEFSWADVNNDAQVTITDLSSIAACWHASAPTTQCPANAYNYWLKPAFHPDSPNTISTEVAVVAAHLDDTYVFPYNWNPLDLKNITPFVP